MNKQINRATKTGKMLHIVAQTSFVVLLGIIISKLLIYAYRIIVARYFGPEVYGLFSLAVIILGIFGTFAHFGILEGVVRYTAIFKAKKDIRKLQFLVIYAKKIILILSIVFALLLIVLAKPISLKIFHNEQLIPYLVWFGFALPLNVLSGLYLSILKGYGKVNLYSFVYNILQNVSKLAMLIFLVIIGIKSESVIFSYMSGILTLLIASYWLCKTKIPIIFGIPILTEKQKRTISKEVFNYSWPLMFYWLIFTLFYWIDSFFIGYFKGLYEVGLYNAAVPIAMLLVAIPELFTYIFFPLINQEYAKGNKKVIEELTKQVTKWILIINLPIFFIFLVYSGVAINVLFGPEYLVAQNSLCILLFGSLFSSVFALSQQLISAIGKSKLVMINMALAALLNIVLNYLLIPQSSLLFLDNAKGIVGASLSTAISMVFLAFLFVLQSRYYLSFFPLRRKMFRVVISSLIPLGIVYWLSASIQGTFLSLLLFGMLYGLLYLLCLFATHSFDRYDLEMLINFFKKRIVTPSPNP